MPVITVNGVFGSGTAEVGQLIAQQLNLNYVDRYVLAEAAKLVGSPVGTLIEKEQRARRFSVVERTYPALPPIASVVWDWMV